MFHFVNLTLLHNIGLAYGPIVEKLLKLLAQMFFRHFSVAKIKYLQFNLTIHPKPQ